MTINDLLAELVAAFPRAEVERETLRSYLRHLADVPMEILAPVVADLIQTNEFFPSISTIREAAAERTLALPGESGALEQIESRIRWAREGAEGEPPTIDPVVREALDHVGGWYAFKSADEPGVVRGQFLRLYRELRAARIREAQVGRPALSPGGLGALTA